MVIVSACNSAIRPPFAWCAESMISLDARRALVIGTVAHIVVSTLVGAQQPQTPYQRLGRDILRELVETNTEHSIGSTTKAAELLAARFRAAGFPASDVEVVGPDTG